MNKKYLYVIIIIISILSVLFILFKSKDKKVETQNSEVFQQKIDIPNYFTGSEIQIENNINKSNFNFPSTLPYLEQSKTQLSNNTINNISTNLGFTFEPLEISDIEKGKLLIWNGEKMNLVVTPKNGQIQYTPNETYNNLVKNSFNKSISEKEYQLLAEDFLINKIGIQKTELSFSNFVYYKANIKSENGLSKSDKNSYDIIQLNYSENSNSLPIYTADPDQSQIYIQFTRDGNIINLTANIGFKFSRSLNEYPLKNFDEFSTNITNSTIVSVDDNNINLSDVKISDLTNLKVNSVSLVYLFESSVKNILQPVYLINGKCNFLGRQVNVVFYLPAFKSF